MFTRFCTGLCIVAVLGVGLSAAAQSPPPPLDNAPDDGIDVFYRGVVIKVIDQPERDHFNIPGAPVFTQNVTVRLESGPLKGQEFETAYSGLRKEQKETEGQNVVVIDPNNSGNPKELYIFDTYRLPSLFGIVIVFIVLILIFARWRGLTSLLGLGVSVLVLTLWVVPKILDGGSPLLITLGGALVIATVSIYLAHGLKWRTTIALISTLVTTGIAMGVAFGFVAWARLAGIGSEEAFYLQTAPVDAINLKGLLLGAIIIGALGVLDDITTAQAAAVEELYRANPNLTSQELLRRGLSIGREHITSLVNTLVLAYAGASFPALLLFTIYQRPWWVVANTEVIAEEVVRTITGSIALICAVPLTTFLAAYVLPCVVHPTGEAKTHTHAH